MSERATAALVRRERGRPPPARVEAIDDEALVRRALTGDQRAEELLVRRHVGELTRVVARLLRSGQEVEDVVQDSLVTALEKLDRLRDPGAFRSWLLRIGVNETRRVYRRRRIRRLVGLQGRDGELGLDELASAEVGPEVRADLALVGEVLSRLPTEARIAWTLRYVEGYELTEVAATCGCSLATIKRRIATANRRVQAVVRVEEADRA